mmetsp:Transcript_19178/g.28662  ORF Transcript_19178/g.28662 Transcript_19178/m.28662 type:complete len:262 (+) Transcript_19178:64-849(+)|eukprot:CAMPEP_0167753790 /NCGR_PEP_ID=MMETSP0110_2-20121227/7908_1 /TAXON_ID=629695 /ORGANISM="Gymnochlora sp., Strain CCMP2014" /LENGTH=261 /DNA_ID=CAMNT_0007639593 /DNA_START=52 /DNA_END=840 /DNA_ORIENTATION=-
MGTTGSNQSNETINVQEGGSGGILEENGNNMGSPQTLTSRVRKLDQDDSKKNVVPTQFRWPYGGKNVYIAGSFNDWKGKVPMKAEPPVNEKEQVNAVFTITLDLPPGTHYYKFIVDDKWQYDPGEERMVNHAGVVHNVIEVKKATDGPALSQLDAVMGDPESYGQEIPRDFTTDPPPIPSQLGHLHLNRSSTTNDSRRAEPPLHVTLNHVCFQKPDAQAPNADLLVVGVTQRYRAKGLPHSKDRFITTICYKPRPGPVSSR